MGPSLVFCHPSDEHYGADRVLLDMWQALPAKQRPSCEVWLPTDLPHGTRPLCEELRRRGATVRHVDMPIVRRTYLTPRGLLGIAGRGLRLLRRLRTTRPETVYCTTSAAFLCAPVARAARVPHVVGHVQEVWGRKDAVLLTVAAGFCQGLVTISEAVKAAMPARLRRRAVVVRNATPDPGPVRALDNRSGPLRFVIAGRWTVVKGHVTLLRAWDLWAQPGELLILGGPAPGGRGVDVPAMVSDLRRPDSVQIIGEVDEVGPYLECADVVVIPSDRPEGFGLTAIEAFARGRPVVGSSFGGIAEIVKDADNGWLFPPGDHVRLAQVLSTLSRDDVARAGHRARQAYEEHYTLERYAREWRAVLPTGRR